MGKEINSTALLLNKYLQKIRPPVEIRDKLDVGYSFDGGKIEFFEIRPRWDNPEEVLNLPYAKIIFVKSRQIWKLYWMRASGKWEAYPLLPFATHLEEILDCIEKDEIGCFKG